MMLKKYLFIVFIGLTCLALGQENDKKFNDRNFVVKFGLLQPLFNELPFSFEHAFRKNMSYEVTAGLTMSKGGNGIQDNPNFNGGNFDYALQGRKLGFLIQASFRFYPLAKLTAPKGLYISPEIKFRQFRNDYSLYDGNGNNVVETRALNHLILRFNVGYQFILRNMFALDLYTGVGFNNRTGNFPTYGTYYDDVEMQQYYYNVNSSLNSFIPHLTIGIKVGIAGKFKNHK